MGHLVLDSEYAIHAAKVQPQKGMTEALSFVSLEGAIGSSSAVAWAPDGSKFATAYRKAIRIIDATTLSLLTEFSSKHPVKSLTWGAITD